MLDNYAAQLALRALLRTLTAATTGSAQIAGTATGYSRSAGSFLTDGFRPGMELTGSGFSNAENDAVKTATAVTALAITAPGCVAEAEAARTLTVGLPEGMAWEAKEWEPITGQPWVEEQFIPGPVTQITLGPGGELESLPLYVVNILCPAGVGVGAARTYAREILELFAPGTPLTVAGSTLQVRRKTAPFEGQLTRPQPGFVSVPVTVPLRFRSANVI
jgi:hypothetical protein